MTPLAANLGNPLDGLDLLVFAVLAVLIVAGQVMRARDAERPFDWEHDA